MKVENKTIIITDPCYIIPDDKDQDWDLCECGEDMTALDHITNCESSSTIYGDWLCTVYEGTIEHNPDKILGKFSADAGMVAVFELDEVLKYNPNFDYHITKPWTTTMIKDFTGEVTIEEINDEIIVIGKGNINFHSIQTG